MQTSHEAVRELKIFAGPTTAKQQRLADQLGIAVGDEPALVTAARLTVALSEQLMLPSAEATDFQWEYITDLAGAVEESAPERPTEYSVASAWISYLMAIRSIKALERLRLEQGDIVVRVSSPRETFFVSSFSKDGRINYRGGSGARDYPHRVRVKARRTDSGSAADAAVKEANNNMEKLRHLDPNFDERRIAHLADYKVPQAASSEAIEALVAIEEADDEKPVQKVIAKYPELLRPIAAGTLGLWAIPQKSLGDTYCRQICSTVHW